MARILVIYHRPRFGDWRATYESHVKSFSRFSDDEVYYLNTDYRRVPRYLKTLDPDLIIYHYTFLYYRHVPQTFDSLIRKIAFTQHLECPKALVPHDEQTHADILNSFVRDFGITHIFTPAPASEWSNIYADVDLDAIRLSTVLTGYVDDGTVRRVEARAKRSEQRHMDIGYRSGGTGPYYGRHGLLKREIGEIVASRAPAFGLTTDISSDYRDAIFGDGWLDFLLGCKYTLGVEGGSGVFDWDGSIAERVQSYLLTHEDPPFEETEAACFPGADGGFRYFLLGPRHFEAVMTRTCQVLIEGDYGGVLEAGKHYIALKRDFSNVDAVLELVREDRLRARLVESAYEDVVASGKYTYAAFANHVLTTALGGPDRGARRSRVASIRMWRNHAAERLWLLQSESAARYVGERTRTALRPVASRVLGEGRLRRLLSRIRSRGIGW